MVRDFNAAAFWAGVAAFVWFAAGMVPLQIAVSAQLALNAAQTSSWIFIVWFSAALSSMVLSLTYRQPIPITWTIPGLIYMGTLAGQFSFAEIVGANLMAGLLIIGFGLVGAGRWIMDWIPLPIIMGMFAGSILGYVTRMVRATVDDTIVAGSTVAGYLAGRALGSSRIPPMAVAILGGGAAVVFSDKAVPLPISWSLPALFFAEMEFTFAAFVAISLPMVVLSMVLGNVQGLGFLQAQGYAVPVKPVTLFVGVGSAVNALLGGCPAIVGRTAVAIVGAPDAGPASGRYVGSVIAALLTISLALAATPVTGFLAVLPPAYVLVLAGLAILSSLQEAFERAFALRLSFGALIAFAVAATPISFLGITSAFWAVVGGMLASLLAERKELFNYWSAGGSRTA